MFNIKRKIQQFIIKTVIEEIQRNGPLRSIVRIYCMENKIEKKRRI